MQQPWVSGEEIAAYLGVNPNTIYNRNDRKMMPANKLGRLRGFLASEADERIKDGHGHQNVATTTNGAATKQKLPWR